MTLRILREDFRIRPSSVDSFYGCKYQWAKQNLEGVNSIPNSRAAIGTAIHAGVEAMWNEAIKAKKTDANLGMMVDAAMESWKDETHDGISFGDKEDQGTCAVEIFKGTEAFIEDIVPFTDIPDAVEMFYEVPLKHALASSIGGTIDYIGSGIIADVKTSKRRSGPAGHTTQQSIYKFLAEANGVEVHTNLIQQVVLKKEPEGAILELEPNIPVAKYLVNGILDVLDLAVKEVAPLETLFQGNPKYMFCSHKFCSQYNTCPFVNGK